MKPRNQTQLLPNLNALLARPRTTTPSASIASTLQKTGTPCSDTPICRTSVEPRNPTAIAYAAR